MIKGLEEMIKGLVNKPIEYLNEFDRVNSDIVPLGFWIDLCKKAEIPYIGAWFSSEFPSTAPYNALDRVERADVDSMRKAFIQANNKIKEMQMNGINIYARWDMCSPSQHKEKLADGRHGYVNGYSQLHCDDFRIERYPGGLFVKDTARIVLRPWVNPLRHKGYPVEFRVFYGQNNNYLGISNYYPQTDLTTFGDQKLLEESISTFRACSERLAGLHDFKHGFTADYMITEQKKLIFIEGGPPHITGNVSISAHPCCFEIGKVDGIALKERKTG